MILRIFTAAFLAIFPIAFVNMIIAAINNGGNPTRTQQEFAWGVFWVAFFFFLWKIPKAPKAIKRGRAFGRSSGPGYVYLMRSGGLTKLGITNNANRRVGEHQRHGWRHVQTWKVSSMNEARDIERTVHNRAARSGHLPKDKSMQAAMPQGGYTEVMTWDANKVRSVMDTII